MNAIIFVCVITLVFCLVGRINVLATIVSMPYMLTYSVINFAYFALETSQNTKWHVVKTETEITSESESTSVLKSKSNSTNTISYGSLNNSSPSGDSPTPVIEFTSNGDVKYALSFLANKWMSLLGVCILLFYYRVCQ